VCIYVYIYTLIYIYIYICICTCIYITDVRKTFSDSLNVSPKTLLSMCQVCASLCCCDCVAVLGEGPGEMGRWNGGEGRHVIERERET